MNTPKWYKPWLAELKVIAMTGMVAVFTVAGAFLTNLKDNADLMAPLPGWVQTIVIIGAPTVATYLTGWATAHTPRASLGTFNPVIDGA